MVECSRMHSVHKRKDAIILREQGYSYGYISSKLSVAKSTLGVWFKGYEHIPSNKSKDFGRNEQKGEILALRIDKAISLKIAEDFAFQKIKDFSINELFFVGIGIYIGEGSKTNNSIRISNSDPRIIKFSIEWFKSCFSMVDSNFRVRIHIYPDSDPLEVLEYWSNQLNLSKDFFSPFSVDRRKNKKSIRRKILPYGTAHLRILSNGDKNFGALLHRKILATIDRILNMRD